MPPSLQSVVSTYIFTWLSASHGSLRKLWIGGRLETGRHLVKI